MIYQQRNVLDFGDMIIYLTWLVDRFPKLVSEFAYLPTPTTSVSTAW